MAIDEQMLYTESMQRNYNQLLTTAIDKLQDKTKITSLSPGSIARSLLEVYYDDLDILYDDLKFSTAMSFLSTAEGIYLDEIAKLFDCERRVGESDENFKYRIQRQVQTKAKANQTAIRLAALSVDGVYDVKMKKFTRGVATFDLYVITEEADPPQEILDQVQQKIEDNQAYGLSGRAITPVPITLDLFIKYEFYNNTASTDKQELINQAEYELREHFMNQGIGSELIINQLIDLLMGIDQNKIKNVQINNIYLDGKQTIINDKELHWDERFIPNQIVIQ